MAVEVHIDEHPRERALKMVRHFLDVPFGTDIEVQLGYEREEGTGAIMMVFDGATYAFLAPEVEVVLECCLDVLKEHPETAESGLASLAMCLQKSLVEVARVVKRNKN